MIAYYFESPLGKYGPYGSFQICLEQAKQFLERDPEFSRTSLLWNQYYKGKVRKGHFTKHEIKEKP